jgi:hypothetical protein
MRCHGVGSKDVLFHFTHLLAGLLQVTRGVILIRFGSPAHSRSQLICADCV